jgi:hypothetical protein
LQDTGILYPAWIHEHLLQQHESLFLLFDGGLKLQQQQQQQAAKSP